jgi:phospholipid/cholesterol/gamma-HCH transport system substrate-binding protein
VSSGPTIDASLPFITQLRLLVRPSELRGLTSDLAVTVPALAHLTKTTIPFMRDQIRPASSCVANVIYPWSQLTLNDPNFNASNGFPPRKAFVEAIDFLPGLAGESRNFDANGPYIRILGNGGTFTYSLQPGLFGQALTKIVAVQPQLPPGAHRPPLQPTVPCETQPAITDLSAPSGPPPQQVASDLSAPGASLRWQSAAQAAVGMLRDVTKQQGLGLNVPRDVFGSGK